jgi:hypothetical protein
MLKNILNLKGAQQLSKKVQLTINGGAGEECPRRCEENTCTSSEYPQCIAFSCTKTDGTVVHETMCMPANQQ